MNKTVSIWWVMWVILLGTATLSAESAPPSIGQAAPDFSLPGSDGSNVALSSLKGKIVVLEWINPDCPFVQRHYQAGTMKKLADAYRGKGVVWLAVNSTHYMTAETSRQWVAKYGLPYPILEDQSGRVGRLYGARTTPHLFIINAAGQLVYSGAIDNDPSGANSPGINYVAQALDELLAGKSVSLAETKPYGCSVKYAK